MDGRERSPWWVVAGALLALIVGNGPIMQFTFGVFIKPLGTEFHAERGTLSAALTAGLVMTGVTTLLIGRLVDRHGVRAVALPAICLFGIGMASIGWFATSPAWLIVLYGLTGIAAAGQTPLPYGKAIAAVFDAQRGLALGIAMAGVGIGTALMPMFAQRLVTEVGWRGAYVGLGLATIVVALPAMAFMVTHPKQGAAPVDLVLAATAGGLTGAEALRSATFWKLAVAFFAVAMAAAGVIAHIVPLLTDRGVAPPAAAGAIGAAGLALIAGRLLAGWALDRVHAPYVALVFFSLPLVGVILLLADAGPGVAVPAAILVGLGLGAEVDLIAFLQSRYLGLRAFGEIYGYLFAIFMLGSGLGPFAMGASFQRHHDYGPALAGLAVGLCIACVLVVRLGPYAFKGRPDVPPPDRDGAAARPMKTV